MLGALALSSHSPLITNAEQTVEWLIFFGIVVSFPDRTERPVCEPLSFPERLDYTDNGIVVESET
jgi:hypothetical protein